MLVDSSVNPFEAGSWGFWEGVLPDADGIASRVGPADNSPVYRAHVVRALLVPEPLVGSRPGVAVGEDY